MSKIGRKPIDTNGVRIDVSGHVVKYKGANGEGTHELPSVLVAQVNGSSLMLTAQKSDALSKKDQQDINRVWGLHRALLNNKIRGAAASFEQKLQIVGLGYKAVQSGKKMVFSLGYSHKIEFELADGVKIDIDKTGQNLSVKGNDKELVGHVCSQIRMLRKPEPYKGTGIKRVDEVILRKSGKTKSS